MGLHALGTILQYGLLIWLGAVGLAVAYRLLNGDMIVTGMLAHDGAGGRSGETTPERMQLMAVMLGAAFAYIWQAVDAFHGGHIKSLPEVPQNLLLIFGGSNVLYLSGKIGRTIR
ncbi:MAG: hypothetical protein ACREHE_07480 [Rhizomicrobium sp.]